MKKGLLTFVFALLVGAYSAIAQMADPVSWNFTHEKTGDNEYTLTFKATIEAGWHMYSMHTPAGGAMPTSFTFNEVGKGIELVGEMTETEPSKQFNDIFKVDEWYFENSCTFTQKVKVTDASVSTITGTVEYQACKESCVQLNKDFSFKISDGKTAEVAPADETAAASSETAKEDDSLWIFFWVAFAGGLAAVVMPCVFPMIPMTVSFFMHGDTNKAKAKAKALFFSLSIIAIYTALGLIIAIFLGPDFINWLSTNWIPNILFFIIFMIFAASFFGAFEIVLPSWLVNKSDKQADKGGFVGAFFMAFTLVLVSFSCTAPIVGTVLVEAARGSILRPIVGMLGFSIAVALPFGFFAFFPSKLNNLPKSGGWLNSVKVVLGFIEVALGFKFLSVADQTYHWGLLDREVYLAVWIVCFTLLGFYLLGKLRFAHDSEVKTLSVTRLALAIVDFTFVVYMIPGMWGAPLKALSGYLPPLHTQDFILGQTSAAADAVTESASAAPSVKYDDILTMPHGIAGYFEWNEALAASRAAGKPLFIDVTGHGCVNCREMEQKVLSDARVQQLLRDDYIVVALYTDDKARAAEEDWITTESGATLKEIGRINSYIVRTRFNVNAQPTYIVADAEGVALLPPREYDLSVGGFITFLEEGVAAYRRTE